MLKNIFFLFLFSFSIVVEAQEGINSYERVSLENCSFNESAAERYECYSKILHDLFVEELNSNLEHLELAPKAVFQTEIEIKLNDKGVFELTEIDTDHKKIEALIRRRVEKLEAVLPLQNKEGNNVAFGFSMKFTFHISEVGKLVSGLPKQQDGGLENLTEPAEFTIIENVPIFPGCDGTDNNEELKKCMFTKIQEHILTNFNFEIANNLELPGGVHRIYVNFKIDNLGKVVDVEARAPHPVLSAEAIRVFKALPQMEPGEHKGEGVGVLYSLPIAFYVAE